MNGLGLTVIDATHLCDLLGHEDLVVLNWQGEVK